jgi:aldehyde:ferredoxin oxidoreductase
MYGGYAGRILRVDLSDQTAEVQELDEKLATSYVGGSGIGTRILYDETEGDTAPLSPENLLVFMTGPLTGSGVPTSGRHEVVFRSPLTGIFARSSAGGHWGVELKQAGFDGIVLGGRADKPVYLWIHDGNVEFKDAELLWGTDTYEVTVALKEATHQKAQVACAGPAGERGVRYACIAHAGQHGRMAGRCGGGAVMGSKNLKAIVVYGTGEITTSHPDKLRAYTREMLPDIRRITTGLQKLGTSGGIMNYEKLGNFPHKNWTLSDWEEGAAKISGDVMANTILTGRYACRHCPIGCGRIVRVAEGPFAPVDGAGPEYETLAALGSNCLVDDLEAIARANELCNRYGLDTMSTGAAISFAMEAFEKGLISEADTGGIELKWGDGKAVLEVIEQIGERQHIGELLGEGVKRAASALGGNAVEFALEVKGLEPSLHDPRCFFSQALNYATASRGPCHNASQSHSCEMRGSQPDIGIHEPQDRHQVQGKAEFTAKLQNLMCMFDSLVMCKFVHATGAIKVAPMVQFLDYVTGWDWDVEQFMKVGERIFNLQRLYNVRCGISRKDDFLPPRFLTLKRSRDKLPPLGQLLSDYYVYRGWTEDGLPAAEKLEDLGLSPLGMM